MEASAPPGDGEWDIVNQAVSGSAIKLGSDGLLTVKVTWEAKSVAKTSGAASYFSGGSTAASTTPDVDISAICFAPDGTALEAIFFNHPKCMTGRIPGAIELVSGDQSSGSVGEEMRLRLQHIPPQCATIALVVTSANSVPLSAVKGICMSATLSEQTSGFSCDHLTWQEEDFPSSPNFTLGDAAKKPAPAQYGGQFGEDVHSVSVPLTLTPINNKQSSRGYEWQLNVVNLAVPNAQTFVEALPKIRKGVELPEGASTKFKIPVVLEKGEALLLQGDQTSCPIHVGCGWDEDAEAAAQCGATSCDADLSVLFLGDGDGGQEVLDTIYWGKLTGFDGAVLHSGDNQTGEGDGDDESIVLNLSHLPSTVTSIMFLVTNYNEGGLKTLKNVHFRVVRLLDEAEIVRYDRIGDGTETAGDYSGFIPCSFKRVPPSNSSGGRASAWSVTCHAAPIAGGKTVHDPEVKEVIAKIQSTRSRGGPTVKPVNLRRSLKDTAAAPGSGVGKQEQKKGGKTAAPLPESSSGSSETKKRSRSPASKSAAAAGDGSKGIPLPVKVVFFLIVVFLFKMMTTSGGGSSSGSGRRK